MAQADSGSSATPLSDVFSAGSSNVAPVTDSDEKEKTEKKPDKVPASDKSNTESSPKKADKEKPKKEDTPTDDKSVRQKPDKDESKDKGEKKDKSEQKSAEDAENKDEKSADDAEKKSDNDPYEKRWKDTQTWANKINQEKLQLQQQFEKQQQQIDILQKKLADPEYDPEKDPKYAGPTPEEIASTAIYAGKATASRDAAIREFGEEKVMGELKRFGELFTQNEAIQMIVKQSNSPVHEAMLIMERVDFEKKYGDRPSKVYDNIRKEVEAEMRKSIRKELIEELREGKKLREDTVQGLSDSRSGNGSDASKSKGEVTHTPLNSIFENNR